MNTLQNKINSLPAKSFQVLTAAIEAISYNESDCEFEDIKVEGLNHHAIAGCLAHLTDFLESEDLELTGSGEGHLITLSWDYNLYEIQNAINVRLSETAETKVKPKVKRLKDSTIKRYTNEQLINHLDRIQSELDEPLYRVTACKSIYEYREEKQAYVHYSRGRSRSLILSCIRRSWYTLGI